MLVLLQWRRVRKSLHFDNGFAVINLRSTSCVCVHSDIKLGVRLRLSCATGLIQHSGSSA